jgi:hypothetical protein
MNQFLSNSQYGLSTAPALCFNTSATSPVNQFASSRALMSPSPLQSADVHPIARTAYPVLPVCPNISSTTPVNQFPPPVDNMPHPLVLHTSQSLQYHSSEPISTQYPLHHQTWDGACCAFYNTCKYGIGRKNGILWIASVHGLHVPAQTINKRGNQCVVLWCDIQILGPELEPWNMGVK